MSWLDTPVGALGRGGACRHGHLESLQLEESIMHRPHWLNRKLHECIQERGPIPVFRNPAGERHSLLPLLSVFWLPSQFALDVGGHY